MTSFESRQSLPSKSDNPTLDVSGHTLIIPCVSIGNVGQLAVDILLASTLSTGEKAEYLCDLDARYCVPFVGASIEANHPALRTPLQVFTFPKSKLTIVQQRSPILKTHKDQFVSNLGKWAREKGFREIICLAGIDAGLRTDTQMQHPFWHLTSSSQPTPGSSLSASFTKLLPVYTRANTHAIHELAKEAKNQDDSIPPMPAGGLVRKILKAAKKESNWVPTTALLVFAAEGDNRADAMAMAKLIVDTTQSNKDSRLSQPSDWNLLFGPPLEPGMF